MDLKAIQKKVRQIREKKPKPICDHDCFQDHPPFQAIYCDLCRPPVKRVEGIFTEA